MKLQVKQLDERSRKRVIFVLERYRDSLHLEQAGLILECSKIIAAIRRGELLLCEYINTDAEN